MTTNKALLLFYRIWRPYWKNWYSNSGKNDKSRTLHVLNKVTRLRSVRFKNLIKAVKEIEQITNFPKLDIEFGIDKKIIIIFQVRPLAIRKLVDRKTDKIINQQ